MKILFLTLGRVDNIEIQGIYSDLLRKFRDNAHEVTIVTPVERKYKSPTTFSTRNGVNILSVWTTNFQKTNLLEKSITTLLIEYYYFFAMRKFVSFKEFDLILYTTPPITFTNLIKKIKKLSSAKTYLLLKDIFPQNAVDLKLLNTSNLAYKYFRKKEKLLYEISDYIGCMSPANKKYLLENNIGLDFNKIEVNPNSIEIVDYSISLDEYLYLKYKVPNNRVIFLFGGNLGIPQGIQYLKNHIAYCKDISDAFFLIVGDGTEFEDLNNWININEIQNALLIKELPKHEFEGLIRISHVGLIFLNPMFSIPNFPSRILSYMQNKLPVICATDCVTDIGEIAFNNKFGFQCLTTDYSSFFDYVITLLNKDLRIEMGQNGYNFLINEYNVQLSYEKIIQKITH
jgi:glycosyltransferase involved in cell wall biosynthesis